jgi:SNF2 family DNA or RNA helicase
MRKLSAIKGSIQLQPHQERFVEKARQSSGLIANHGLGSGKTLSSLAVAEERGGKTLVVAPASLIPNYHKEISKFVTPDRRKDYEVISYAALRARPEEYAALRPKTLILDEIHRARNAGKTREAVKLVRRSAGKAIGLTGSLAANELADAPRLVSLVAGTPVMSTEEFKRQHIKRTKRYGKGLKYFLSPATEETTVVRLPELHKKLGPYVDRFTGSEEYRQHTPTVADEVVPVTMTKQQQRLYKALLRENPGLASKVKKNLPPSRSDLRRMGAFMTGLRMVSNSPAAFDVTMSAEDSPKANAVADRVLEALKNNPDHRAVVYSNFVDSGIMPVKDRLEAQGVRTLQFTGGEPKKVRSEAVRAYNAGEVPVLLLSPAGGEGLDLRGTRAVHLMEDHWNPERAAQAIGRAARYKSHSHLPEGDRNVLVHRYHAVPEKTLAQRLLRRNRDSSADEWIYNRQKEKDRLNKQLLSAFNNE